MKQSWSRALQAFELIYSVFETWSPWYAYTCVYYHPKPRRLCYKALSSQLRLLQICLCKVWHRSLELGTEYLASVFAIDRSSTCSWCVKKLMQFLLLDIKLFLSLSWYSGCFLPKLQCSVIPQIDRVQLTQFFHRYTRVGHCMQRLVRDSSRLQIQRSIHEVIIMFDLTCGQDSICITVWAPHPCAHQAIFFFSMHIICKVDPRKRLQAKLGLQYDITPLFPL